MERQYGALVISLDFEIMWGVRDKKDIRNYYMDNLLGVRKVIPALLQCFFDYEIHGTFATVGLLFASNKKELLQYLPVVKPGYKNKNLSPYINYFELVGEDETQDPLHYACNLIALIKKTPNQEIASHTFSHYYCLEPGQTPEAFQADLQSAQAIASAKGFTLKSLVFPRNQFNDSYLKVLQENDFICYRGNERSWMYKAKKREKETIFRRMVRLADSYINLSGHNTYSWDLLIRDAPLYNIPASQFLRPYHHKLRRLEKLKLKRILRNMTYAAKHNHIYHLWWHPHNFGINIQQNLNFLQSILLHYQKLKQLYGFESLTMSETSQRLDQYYHAK